MTKVVASDDPRPHPNSVWAKSDEETRRRIVQARREALADQRAMEYWYKSGCVSRYPDDDDEGGGE